MRCTDSYVVFDALRQVLSRSFVEVEIDRKSSDEQE
jgi:hypothetical protein